ncbi:Peptidyl-tRNA hydrolase ICT1, mitochondrial [Morella rubra]|uniref:Peptidyl-tRNA hydrolase ICT1, mitochondrial n=1 Tax=Morella rubra TaxID=262757 RepID=A0A6A1VVY6_9ROSI|nr:Peptidyl-tRNA hydrolase ICT1, mitochondrial [Morella rubra]KAB1217089.1 Peptidyl-tRNA hydrolase ICT1, mitochondrial [Morella rubra]KAB1217098.1 Peptidyl-tRNA hydrolase ICT1, mitochondrial [Morella rubra]
MAIMRTTTSVILRGVVHLPSFSVSRFSALPGVGGTIGYTHRGISFGRIQCAASDSGDGRKVSARLSQVQQLLQEAEERALSADDEPTPKITIALLLRPEDVALVPYSISPVWSWKKRGKGPRGGQNSSTNSCIAWSFERVVTAKSYIGTVIGQQRFQPTFGWITDNYEAQLHFLYFWLFDWLDDSTIGSLQIIWLDHVTVNFARSGGPGGQNVNKVNTKVDMRFNVKSADWLSDRIKEKIIQMEKNRINKDGELVISSTKTRTQKGNIQDALEKLQVLKTPHCIRPYLYSVLEAIIDAASYVPPPPTEEQKKKIAKLAAIGEQKRLKSKKVLSEKKAFRRSRDSWD